MPKHKTAVEFINGAHYFTLDGKAMNIPAFETYRPEGYFFKQFSDAGTKVFSFNTNPAACDYGHSLPTRPERDRYDYSQLDTRVYEVLNQNPDAMIIPRVMMGTPRWWLDENPDELMVLDDGDTQYKNSNFLHTLPKGRPFPSLASQKWRDDTAEGLRALIRHIQESDYADNIFGYFITGLHTEEWYHWSAGYEQLGDYSEPARAGFGRWLKAKYGDTASLRRAWNDERVDFDTVTIPSRDERVRCKPVFRNPDSDMRVIDFYLYYNELIPDTIDYFAAVIKEATGRTKAVGAFYAYMYEFFGDPEYGHNALSKYNESKNLDFVFVTASYEDRKPGVGGDYMRSPSMSVALNGKLWYHDNDTASFRSMQSMRECGMSEEEVIHYARVLGAAPDAERTKWMYRRSAGFCLANGMYESFFDLHGGYFDHPELMNEVRRLNRIFERAPEHDRSSVAEVLVVSDEASCSYCTFRNPMLHKFMRDMQTKLIKLGVPCDHVLTADLDKIDITQYKAVIALNLFNANDRVRRSFDSFKNSGRTIIWNYAPGYFNGNRSGDELMHELCGIKLRLTDEYTDAMFEADGYRGGEPFGISEKIFNRVYIDDTDCEVLARHTDGNAAIVRCGFDGWSSVYTMNLCFEPSYLRKLLSDAGIHIYNDRDDTFYLNASYMVIHADGDGKREVKLPRFCRIYDEIEERVISDAADSFSIQLRDGETVIYSYQSTAKDV